MKRVVIMLVLLVALATPAAAQGGAGFGARVGVNFANLNFDPEDEEFDVSTRTGLVAGVFATVPVAPRFAFQPELLFSQQGAKGEESGIDATIKLNYVNVPLLGSFAVTQGDYPVSFLIGPQIGFNTSAKIEADDLDEEEDLDEITESTDWGIVTGIAASIQNFVIDARYTHGLTNINSEENEEKVKNRVFTISVGIRFR